MRIGINVPNGLLQQVKKIRPKVNVSQVCREALGNRVTVAQMATAQVQDDGMAEEVERLHESATKPVIEPDWVSLALDDARDWVRGITREGWDYFIHQCDVLKRQGRDEMVMMDLWSMEHGAKGFWHHYQANEDWVLNQLEIQFETGVSVNLIETVKEKYGRAWLSYVLEVRRLLEKRRKGEYDKIMAERAAALKARPAPELPHQLL